jgi:hypothetical protein
MTTRSSCTNRFLDRFRDSIGLPIDLVRFASLDQ